MFLVSGASFFFSSSFSRVKTGLMGRTFPTSHFIGSASLVSSLRWWSSTAPRCLPVAVGSVGLGVEGDLVSSGAFTGDLFFPSLVPGHLGSLQCFLFLGEGVGGEPLVAWFLWAAFPFLVVEGVQWVGLLPHGISSSLPFLMVCRWWWVPRWGVPAPGYHLFFLRWRR